MIPIIALDPGTKSTGYVVLDGKDKVLTKGEMTNPQILKFIGGYGDWPHQRIIAVERILPNGSTLGESTRDTIEWAAWFFMAGSLERSVWVTRSEELRYYGVAPFQGGNNDRRLRLAVVAEHRFEHKVSRSGAMIVPGWSSHTLAALAVGMVARDKIRMRDRVVR